MHGDAETISFRSGDLDLYGQLRHRADEAPTVVLLCGLGFHTFEYEPLATQLAAAGWNSLSFDYRGHGRSGGPRGRWTLDELVADCRHAVDFVSQRHSGPIGLFGNSLGAMVAILTGVRDDRLLGVVAANCPARIADFLLTRPRRALFSLAKLIGPFAPMRISVDHFYSYEQLIDDRSWVSTIQRDPLIADARRLSVTTFRTLLETWNGPEAARELHEPLLVIQGGNDHLQPPKQSQLVFEAANDPKKYEVVDTGHLPHLEAPKMLAGLLIEWFSGLTR
jgi:alpha-beta hydrolase superfamily lysophospholipase